MKSVHKAIFRNRAVQSILGALAGFYLWLVRVTSSWTRENDAATAKAWSGAEPVIVAFWHNRLLLMPYCWRSKAPFHMLISSHADGRLIAKTIKWHGISTVTGSSSKGGTDALRQLIRFIKEGTSVGITPDGPRGPRMQSSDGALSLAKLSGAVIVPAAAATSRRRVLNTWDRLVVPLPFSRGACVWGNPIKVPRESTAEDLERIRKKLETSLIDVSNRADALVGQDDIAPAEAETTERKDHASA
mgnify:CR=1 FL=1|tara:strand:+ start:346 stop:1080 length:735 start_codon:yes stop_codon:yes gene_type:complete